MAPKRDWELFHGDGVDGLLAYGSVDHVFTDADDVAEETGCAFGPGRMTDALRLRSARAIATQCRRWALVFCSDLETHLWRDALVAAGMIYYRQGYWIRLGTKPQADDGPDRGAETIVIAHSRGVKQRWNGGLGKPAVWYAPVVRGVERKHPKQKPLALMRQLVEDFSDEGETIFDPYMGYGTTGIAAVGLGRRFVGYDTDERHFKNTQERFALPLFDNGRRAVQNELFRAPKGAAKRERMEFDRAIYNLIVARNGDGAKLSEIVDVLAEDPRKINRSLKRLQRAGAVRREGKTSDTQYYAAQSATPARSDLQPATTEGPT